eukprot:scaffold370_cov349-Pavlova_lutheri.AAC.21
MKQHLILRLCPPCLDFRRVFFYLCAGQEWPLVLARFRIAMDPVSSLPGRDSRSSNRLVFRLVSTTMAFRSVSFGRSTTNGNGGERGTKLQPNLSTWDPKQGGNRGSEHLAHRGVCSLVLGLRRCR